MGLKKKNSFSDEKKRVVASSCLVNIVNMAKGKQINPIYLVGGVSLHYKVSANVCIINRSGKFYFFEQPLSHQVLLVICSEDGM